MQRLHFDRLVACGYRLPEEPDLRERVRDAGDLGKVGLRRGATLVRLEVEDLCGIAVHRQVPMRAVELEVARRVARGEEQRGGRLREGRLDDLGGEAHAAGVVVGAGAGALEVRDRPVGADLDPDPVEDAERALVDALDRVLREDVDPVREREAPDARRSGIVGGLGLTRSHPSILGSRELNDKAYRRSSRGSKGRNLTRSHRDVGYQCVPAEAASGTIRSSRKREGENGAISAGAWPVAMCSAAWTPKIGAPLYPQVPMPAAR